MSWYAAFFPCLPQQPIPAHAASPFLLCLQRTATRRGSAQREELGVVLYGAQQQLAQLQTDLHQSHERCARAAAARRRLEEELEAVRLTYKKTWQDTDDERKKGD